MTKKSNIRAIYSGVDWITATMQGDEGLRAQWANKGIHILEELAKKGEKLGKRSLMGYMGIGFGNCFVGARDDSTMIQLTSVHADRYFYDVMSDAVQVSRIDVQCTVQYNRMPRNIVTVAYRMFMNAIENGEVNALSKGSKLTGVDGSATLYLGAPSSDRRGCIYNKEVESGEDHYKRCWRYECRYRNEIANSIAHKLLSNRDKYLELTTSITQSFFKRKGIIMDWNEQLREDTLPMLEKNKPTVDRQLVWLRSQVRPTVQWLISMGKEKEVWQALGLEPTEDIIRYIRRMKEERGQ